LSYCVWVFTPSKTLNPNKYLCYNTINKRLEKQNGNRTNIRTDVKGKPA
jgi:hypothetical protein